MAENFKRKSCIFLSIRAQEASGLNLQKGIFCNRFQCFSQRCCLNQEIYLAARPPQLVFLISKIKVFGLHLTPSKCCDNPVLSQKIFRFKNRFTETKLFFPPLVPPLCMSFHQKTIFIGSLHAAYSALRHFSFNKKLLNRYKGKFQYILLLIPNNSNKFYQPQNICLLNPFIHIH